MIDPRLLPEGFLDVYRRELGGEPPTEFLDAYELLCESLYFGVGLAPEAGNEGYRKGRTARNYWFGDPGLLDPKAAVDNRLAAIRKELRAWAAARKGEEPRGSRSKPAHGSDLAGPRGTGRDGPDKKET